MASQEIIDEFIVTLGLDGSEYDKGMVAADKRQNKLRQSAAQWDKERRQARTAEDRDIRRDNERKEREASRTYKTLRRDALAFFSVFTAGKAVKNFFADTINNAAGLGYLAQNLGKSTESLTAWQLATERAGGSAEGIIAQFKESADTLAALRTGLGPNEGLQNFFRFGGNKDDLKDAESYLLARSRIVNEVFQTDPTKAALLARQMGILEDQFDLIKQGPEAINALVAAQRKNAVVTAESAERARQLKNQWLDFTQTLEASTIKVLIASIPALSKFTEGLVTLANKVGDNKDDIAQVVSDLTNFLVNTDWSGVIASAKEFGGEVKSIADSLRDIINRYDEWMGKPKVQTEGVTKLPGAIAFGKDEAMARDRVATGRPAPAPRNLSQWQKEYVEGLDKGVGNTVSTFGALKKSDHPIIDAFTGGSLNKFLKELIDPKRPVDPKKAGYIMSRLKSLGWNNEQAAGITGSLAQESDLDFNALNASSGAYGIAQWLSKDRLKAFRDKYGKDIRRSTLDEQIDFMHYELTQGGEKEAGRRLKAAKTAEEAAEIHSRYYERPGADEANNERRKAIGGALAIPGRARAAGAAATVPNGAGVSAPAARGGDVKTSSVTNIDQININTQATDAVGIARTITPAVEKYTSATNAISGMT